MGWGLKKSQDFVDVICACALREHQISGMASAAAGAGGAAGGGGGGTSPGAVRKFSSPSAAGQTPGSDTGFGTPSGKKVVLVIHVSLL